MVLFGAFRLYVPSECMRKGADEGCEQRQAGNAPSLTMRHGGFGSGRMAGNRACCHALNVMRHGSAIHMSPSPPTRRIIPCRQEGGYYVISMAMF